MSVKELFAGGLTTALFQNDLTHARGLTKLRLRQIAPGVLTSALGAAETLRLLRHAGYVPAAASQDGTPYVERSTARAQAR
jgi:hypothetical protein